MYLRCFIADSPTLWFKLLPWAEFWYNTSFQHSSKMTPFEVVYGRPPPTITRFIADSSHNQAVVENFRQRDETLAILKDNLHQAQARMKALADKGRRDISFEVGDWVYVRFRPYRQLSMRLQRYSKLSRRFFGPFKILQRIGVVAYKLDLPTSSRIHNVFHGKLSQQVTPNDLLDPAAPLIFQPGSTLQHMLVSKGGHQIQQFLIR